MRLSFLSAMLFISAAANAQFTQGDKFLGGSFYFGTQRSNYDMEGYSNRSTGISLMPRIGFLLSENLAIGGQLSASDSKITALSNYTRTESRSSGLGAGFFAERYFVISDKFLFSIVGSVDFLRMSLRSEYTASGGETHVNKYDGYDLQTTFRPTFIFFPSSKWGIQAGIGSLGYSFRKSLSEDDKTNAFHMTYGSINLGIVRYFRH
jgi:hypothetical protein